MADEHSPKYWYQTLQIPLLSYPVDILEKKVRIFSESSSRLDPY